MSPLSLLSWTQAQPSEMPAPDEVHVWAISDPLDWEAAHETLISSEWIRADRFRFDADRERYLRGRLALRQLLGTYLNADPAVLDFTTGPHGKPLLSPDWSGLRFNLSHSDDLLLIACARGREVGVDVELKRENVPFETLADAYFDPEDAWRLRLLAPEEKAEYFYEVWTRTEAGLKAEGVGLTGGLQISQPERWSIMNLQPLEKYAAALAVEGSNFHLECAAWPK